MGEGKRIVRAAADVRAGERLSRWARLGAWVRRRRLPKGPPVGELAVQRAAEHDRLAAAQREADARARRIAAAPKLTVPSAHGYTTPDDA